MAPAWLTAVSWTALGLAFASAAWPAIEHFREKPFWREFLLFYTAVAFVRTRHRVGIEGLKAAIQADTLSLTAFEIGPFGWMAIVHYFMLPSVNPNTAAYWFMMQIGMYLGFATSYPMIGGWFATASRSRCSQPSKRITHEGLGIVLNAIAMSRNEPVEIPREQFLQRLTAFALVAGETQANVGRHTAVTQTGEFRKYVQQRLSRLHGVLLDEVGKDQRTRRLVQEFDFVEYSAAPEYQLV